MEGLTHISNPSTMTSSSLGTAMAVNRSLTGDVAVPMGQASQVTGLSDQAIRDVVRQANEILKQQGSQRTVSFGYEEKLGQMFVQIRDGATGAVVGEFPSKDVRASQIAMREMIGLILDKQG